MSGPSQWVGEPSRPGWLGRLVSPGRDRPSPVAFVLAVAAAVAFIGSLASDWMSVTGSLSGPRDSESALIYGADIAGGGTSAITIRASNNVTTLTMLGLIYGLGALALLVMAGAVLHRADLALRMRMPMAALGVGVVAVVVASLIRLPTILLSQNVAYSGFGTPTTVVRAYQPGLFCALAVGILPVAAVWVRSAPAARAAAQAGYGYPRPTVLVELPPPAAPAGPFDPTPAANGPAPVEAVEPEAWSRLGSRETAAGWSRAGEPPAPYDLSVTPDD